MTETTWVGPVAFLVSTALTPVFRRYAVRRQRLDVPNDRSMHQIPTPRSGGNAIVIGGAMGLATASAVLDRGMFVFAAATIFLIGLAIADERGDLPRGFRFFVQLGIAITVVAVALTWIGMRVEPISQMAGGVWILGILGTLWLTWMVNAYNFMDGVNGMASSGAVVCGLAMAVLFGMRGDLAGQALALAMAGGAAGFLPWNLARGWIFMGDVGSTSLGFLLGALVVRAAADGFLIPALLPLVPFLFDTVTTLLTRMLKGERFFSTRHRSHFYQRLALLGWPHARVTGLWVALATICSLGAVAYSSLSVSGRALLIAGIAALHGAVALGVIGAERRAAEVEPAGGSGAVGEIS